MNLEESDSYKEEIEKNIRQRRSVVLSIVICAMVAALLFVMIMILKYQDSITLKLYLNDQQIRNIPQGLYRDIEGKTYLDVKMLGELLGYSYTKGVYGEYNEDPDSCYLQNNFEIIALTADKDKYTKYIEITEGEAAKIAEIPVLSMEENGYSESFSIADAPIVYLEDRLYVCREYAPEMFNMQIDWQEYRIRFYSFEHIVNSAKMAIEGSGYTEVSSYYENLRALLYGLAVVGNESKEYGVYSLSQGKEIISLKYDKIEFVQNTKEFYITVGDGTMGILGADGSTIIKPSEYQDIELLDEAQRIYIVKNDGEYGVVGKKGQVIIHPENDSIGYDVGSFINDDIDNAALFFKKCIPVEKDKKFGLYSTDGKMLLSMVNDTFGCVSNTSTQTSGSKENVLLIPSEVGINGIVYSFDGRYGIYDVNAETPAIPPACESVYAITKDGQKTYYFDYMGVTYDLKQYLIDKGLNNIDTDPVETETPEEPVEETPVEDTNTTEETPTETPAE